MTRRHVTARDFRDEPVDRPATWFMPHRTAGPSETFQRKGYVLRVSGDTAATRERLGVEPRLVAREFICPVHGRFTREADEQTDEVACPEVLDPRHDWTGERDAAMARVKAGDESAWHTALIASDMMIAALLVGHVTAKSEHRCGLTAPWSPSRVGQGKSAGEMNG